MVTIFSYNPFLHDLSRHPTPMPQQVSLFGNGNPNQVQPKSVQPKPVQPKPVQPSNNKFRPKNANKFKRQVESKLFTINLIKRSES
jgi:hypothetical protein